ncbi:MAG: 7TM diverse intracellular signaling domain-containing protein [Gallionella sp.]|nr:7TM diverse intracellular signaling domain-containing protein [Gallionella sp.]
MMPRYLLASLLALLTSMAGAAPLPAAKVDMSPIVEYLEDAGGKLTFVEVSGEAASRFKPLKSKGDINLGYSKSTFWFRVPLAKNKDGAEHPLLEVRFYELGHVAFYAPGLPPVVTGQNYPLSSRAWPHRFYVFPLTLTKAPRYHYLQVRSDSAVTVSLTLWEPAAFAADTQQTYMLQALYFGALLALLLYNLFIYFSLRERGFLLYSLFAACMGLSMLTGNGFAQQFLWPTGLVWNAHIVPLTNALGAASALYFAQHFLQTRTVLPGLHRAMHLTAGCALLAAFAPWLNISAGAAGVVLSLCLIIAGIQVITAGIRALRAGNRSARVFLLAWGALSLGAIVSGMRNFGLLPTTTLTVYAVQISSFAEMLLLSFALAERIRLERNAREAAQADALVTRQSLVETLRESETRLEKAIADRTIDLNMALAESRKTNQTQSRLVAYIGHDLRAPLATIINYVRLLGHQSDEQSRRYQSTIERSATHQLELIDDLVEYARGKLEHLELVPAPAYLHDWLNDIARQAELLAVQYGNRFELKVTGDMPPVAVFDPKRLRQILINLLQNAAKFTSGGQIRLCLHAAPSADGKVDLEFAVEDTGPGIAQQDRERIFLPFERSQSEREGSGLGLSIAHKLVNAMGSKLTLASATGKGSRFGFTLTVDTAEEADVPHPMQAFNFPEPFGAGKTLLVADDNAASRDYLREVLSAADFEIVCAQDGAEALRLTKERRFDAVLVDQFMPGADGWDVLRRLHAANDAPPIILCSAMPAQRPDDFPPELDFNTCLLKPVGADTLLQTMRRLFGKALSPIPDALLNPLRDMIADGCITEIEEWASALKNNHPEHADFADSIRDAAQRCDLGALTQLLNGVASI